ncbi:MAG: hypothetical protein AB7O57_23540 [Hyphomicrobiaceae bacterium]
MEYNEFSWEKPRSMSTGATLSAADVETMAQLMTELRDVTLSRKSYLAASDFLKRFGHDIDATSLVRPETLAS